MYESVKARLEAEEAQAAEEQRLVDELRAEEVAAAARHEAAQRAAHQARMRAQMLADNQAMLANKVLAPSGICTHWNEAPKTPVGCMRCSRLLACPAPVDDALKLHDQLPAEWNS